MLLVGTADGLLDLALDGREERRTMAGAEVRAVSGDWAVAEGRVIALDTGDAVALPAGLVPRCVAALAGGRPRRRRVAAPGQRLDRGRARGGRRPPGGRRGRRGGRGRRRRGGPERRRRRHLD